MIFNKPRSFYLLVFVLLTLNLLFFLPLVIKLPDFLMDDFMLFSIIDKNPAGFILTNPGEIVHMIVRPLTFFSLWFDHVILNLSSFQMKLETLSLQLAFAAVFCFFAYDLLDYLKVKVNAYKLSFVALILTTHTICTWWILWVALRNEILMLLFYALALYSVLLFLKSNKSYFLSLSLLFYIFSFLSKQQSLHFPLLVIATLLFFRDNFSAEQRRKLAYFTAAGVLLMLTYFVINFMYYSDTSLLQYSGIWKKPLSAVSAIGLALAPLETDKIYNYLLGAKMAAVAIFVILSAGAVFIFIKNVRARKTLAFLVIIFAISFFPVLSAEISVRLITLQVFMIYLALAYIVQKIKLKDYFVYPALAVLLILNVRASITEFNGERTLNDKRKECVVKLDEFIRTNNLRGENTILLASPFGLFAPYQYHYFKFNTFGKDSLTTSPFGYTFYFKNFYTDEINNPGETVFNALSPDSLISILTTKDYVALFKADDLKGFKIIHEERSGLRGYNKIDFMLPDEYKNFDKIYYDGKNWMRLK